MLVRLRCGLIGKLWLPCVEIFPRYEGCWVAATLYSTSIHYSSIPPRRIKLAVSTLSSLWSEVTYGWPSAIAVPTSSLSTWGDLSTELQPLWDFGSMSNNGEDWANCTICWQCYTRCQKLLDTILVWHLNVKEQLVKHVVTMDSIWNTTLLGTLHHWARGALLKYIQSLLYTCHVCMVGAICFRWLLTLHRTLYFLFINKALRMIMYYWLFIYILTRVITIAYANVAR